MSIKLVMSSSYLFLYHPFCSFCLPSFPASESFQMSQLFTWGGQSIKSFSFSISPSNEYSGMISFRMDWMDLLAVQGILKSLLQHHSSKASILPVFSFVYSPTITSIHDYCKNHSFDYQNFVGKVMSLLFNMLSRLVIAFLPRSKNLNFMAAVTICSDFGDQENKVYHCFPIYVPWRDGTGCCDLSFLNVEL